MSRFLIVVFATIIITTVTATTIVTAYAQQCRMWQCTNIGNMQQCICVGSSSLQREGGAGTL